MISKVTRKVIKTYPEMRGAEPSVRKQSANGKDLPGYVLTYRGTVSLPGSRTMKRVVRVVIGPSGKIIRMSSSK